MFDQKEQRQQAVHHLRLALRDNAELQSARDLLEVLENPGGARARRGTLDSPVSVQ
jgi:hypothetical protein